MSSQIIHTAENNPFRVDRVHAIRYLMDESEWVELEQKWNRHHARGAIIGPHGHGKTTLLEAWKTRLEKQGNKVFITRLNSDKYYFTSPEWNQIYQAISEENILMIDSAGCLSLWEFQKLMYHSRKARGLIITAHHKTRLVTLKHCKPDLKVLKTIVIKLTTESTWQDNQDIIEQLFKKNRGDIRKVLRTLYDYCADGKLLLPEGA